MNGRENIIRMAREAGLSDLIDYNLKMHPDCFIGKWDDLVKLYQLVTAAERERVFQELLCMHENAKGQHNYYLHAVVTIRARGQQ